MSKMILHVGLFTIEDNEQSDPKRCQAKRFRSLVLLKATADLSAEGPVAEACLKSKHQLGFNRKS